MNRVHYQRTALVLQAITIYMSQVEFIFAKIKDNTLQEGQLTNATNPGIYEENYLNRFLDMFYNSLIKWYG